MKYIVILSDGMSDYPMKALNNKTPMESANKKTMDKMSAEGEVFLVKTVADNLKPGSDVANLAVLGYDPNKYYTGRSPLEGASIGVNLLDTDTAFRANLVSLSGEGEYKDLIMKDYSSDEITTAESREIINTLSRELVYTNIKLYSGISYRHLMVWGNAPKDFNLTPPHDISGKPVLNYLPNNDVILEIMVKSREILKNHPVNVKRRERGLNTADSLWIWGEGKKPSLDSFYNTFGVKGAVISAVDLIRGIGHLAEMEVIEVEGATGNIHTNFVGKAMAAIDALERNDFVYVHLEAPDECGHRGEIKNKVKAIELIDEHVVKYIKDNLEKKGILFKMMILPDHATPLSTKTHSRDPVPCLIYHSNKKLKGPLAFSEKTAAGKIFDPGYKLMSYFLDKEGFSKSC